MKLEDNMTFSKDNMDSLTGPGLGRPTQPAEGMDDCSIFYDDDGEAQCDMKGISLDRFGDIDERSVAPCNFDVWLLTVSYRNFNGGY
ncbi:jg10062 [Pararge aegeria aegeria]|uniref:Jg10062 protein n=1 Tax=Pararge aegeria aegeria TaxID=348720 RepID=A0A8S4SG65_9NEOP|nr:jg10062 [Pararge aegeria aegeria]